MQSEPRIVCAAIRAQDGTVLVGIRHYSSDMHSQIMARNDGEKFLHRQGDDQGFVDQHGTYYTRHEAMKIAVKQGQLNNRKRDSFGRLYSEDLY